MAINPIPLQPPTLQVVITQVELTLGGMTYRVSLDTPIDEYACDELFVSGTIASNVLQLSIGQTPTQAQATSQTVDTVVLSISYGGEQPLSQTVPIAPNTNIDLAQLGLTVKLSQDVGSAMATIVVSDSPITGPDPNDRLLSFILVKDEDDSQYTVNWVSPGIDVDSAYDTAHIIVMPPARHGSITGPMGISTP